MKGTVPIITCDDEYGCDEWELDHFEMCATNWRELLGGWKYNPYDSAADIFCPRHAEGAGESPAPTPPRPLHIRTKRMLEPQD